MLNVQVTYKLRQRRREKALSIRELANRSGVSKSYISDIENDFKHPTLPILVMLADALSIPTNKLFIIKKTVI